MATELEAVWDDRDNVYRCPQCMWELERGRCPSGCQLEFDIDAQDDADYTSNEAFNPDRVARPRGGTPLQEVDHLFVPPSQTYSGGLDEYEQLRRRGATRLMCETFHLEFYPDCGIVAWADSDIYEEFAGPLMQKGDFWKIMLGRRIKLDEDDPDGSAFMEALLEDALVFPLISTCKWETVEESPGIWVTRAIGITPRGTATGSEHDSADDSTSSYDSYHARQEAWELELEMKDKALEPGYVAPSLPINAHRYEAQDAESDVDMAADESVPDEADDSSAFDPGWTYEAHVPDTCWVPPESEDEDVILLTAEDEDEGNAEGNEEVEGVELVEEDLDSADSDFDSDEVLSGDEPTLAVGRIWMESLQ
ncbi:hypothetical protein FB451DRAFT_539204 [Mycena latifolia]|nr:hypothetical protein FB451DRAFT_539204 [Mycena latifolia]